MAKRPALTEDSFLKHLFSPKRNPLPSGIRKTALSGLKGGRVKSRLASYNRMSGASQEMLRRSGMREAYLRREVTLSDARKSLRTTAVAKGIAKPLRVKASQKRSMTTLDAAVAGHVIRSLRGSGRKVNALKVYDRIPYLPDEDKENAVYWPVAKIRAYAGDDNNIVIIDGVRVNPLWYG